MINLGRIPGIDRRRQARVSPHHLGRLPATQLLQDEERHASLYQPARPGVAQVVPAEVRDAGALEGLAPASGIDACQK